MCSLPEATLTKPGARSHGGACPLSQVDQIYALSQTAATTGSAGDFKNLETCLAELKPDQRVLVGILRSGSWCFDGM